MQLRIKSTISVLVLVLLISTQINGYVIKDTQNSNSITDKDKPMTSKGNTANVLQSQVRPKRETCAFGLCVPPVSYWHFYISSFFDNLIKYDKNN